MPALTIAQIAELCGGEIAGDAARIITGANALHDARETDLSFVANSKASAIASTSRAGCLLIHSSFEHSGPWSLIRVADPRAAFARVLVALYPKTRPAAQVHSTAVIAASATLARDCFIGPYAVIGEEARIGSRCIIGAGSSIGDRVTIGEDTTLHPNVTVYENVQIGARAILHSGCVIGADGFGFTLSGDRYEKFPQVGTVEIGDDVEIGANCCIDRAALGVTRIRDGAKLDNLIHVAHNCTIGVTAENSSSRSTRTSLAPADCSLRNRCRRKISRIVSSRV
jgi:UDP-3-O-[3-hydroxymyristoyl] glucosamine N-acyltransferase